MVALVVLEVLLNHIAHYATLNETEIETLLNNVKKANYRKGDAIFTEGRISNEIYFVTRGCVRLYYRVDGVDKTAFFYLEGQFICAGESYTYGVPAHENFEAVEDTELYVFSKETIEKLMAESSVFELIARIAVENELIVAQKMIATFVTKSAEERYLELLEQNGDLFQRVPQQYLASYLGVSPETLSRIKRRVFQKRNS